MFKLRVFVQGLRFRIQGSRIYGRIWLSGSDVVLQNLCVFLKLGQWRMQPLVAKAPRGRHVDWG